MLASSIARSVFSSRSVAGRGSPAGARVAVPRACEAGQARTPAVSVSREHRTDPAAPVGVRADDDVVGLDPAEHRLPAAERHAVDGGSKFSCWPAASHWRFTSRAPEDALPVAIVQVSTPRRPLDEPVAHKRRKESCMRLGLNLGYWGLGLTVDEQLGLVKTAEDVGFDSVWAAEAYGSDAATVLAWLRFVFFFFFFFVVVVFFFFFFRLGAYVT